MVMDPFTISTSDWVIIDKEEMSRSSRTKYKQRRDAETSDVESSEDETVIINTVRSPHVLIDGDDLDIDSCLETYFESDTKTRDTALIELCTRISLYWKVPSAIMSPLTTHPNIKVWAADSSYTYATDQKLNNGYQWLVCLNDPKTRRFISKCPVPSHYPSEEHHVYIHFSLPDGDYTDLILAHHSIINATKQSGSYKLVLGNRIRDQLKKICGDSIKQDDLDYHFLLKNVTVLSRRNDSALSLSVALVTTDPETREPQVWCDTRQIASASDPTRDSGPMFILPALSSESFTAEPMWTQPPEHNHPDVRRWLHADYTVAQQSLHSKLVHDTKVTIGNDTVGRGSYSIYRIEMPDADATKTDSPLQFIIWERYGSLLLRTKAIPGINATQLKEFTEYNVADKSFRVIKAVYDSIFQEYAKYMRHRDYLVSLNKEISLSLTPVGSIDKASKAAEAFKNNAKGGYMGAINSTLQITYEKFIGPGYRVYTKPPKETKEDGGPASTTTTTLINVASEKESVLKGLKSKNKNKSRPLSEYQQQEEQSQVEGLMDSLTINNAVGYTSTTSRSNETSHLMKKSPSRALAYAR